MADSPGHHSGSDGLANRRDRSITLLPPVCLSQFARVRKDKRRHPPRVFVQNERAGDRWFGALAAILTFTQPAIDADRGALGGLEIKPAGIDEFRRMPDFAPQSDRKARLGLRMWCRRTSHHLRDREV